MAEQVKPDIKEAWSGIQTGPKPVTAVVLGCINGTQKRGTVSVLGSIPQYSGQKYSHPGIHNGEYGKGLQR
jgi:hypothetical protein